MFNVDPLKQDHVVNEARKLLGIHEVPDGSNNGPGVHMIQSSTGAFGEPWCVSTVQFVWEKVFGVFLADRTANAYYLADWGLKHALTIPVPLRGCPVVYHLGDGHAGIVSDVGLNGSFHAIEGNEANAVRWVQRNLHQVRCTFLLPHDLLKVPLPHVPVGKAPEVISEHGKGQN